MKDRITIQRADNGQDWYKVVHCEGPTIGTIEREINGGFHFWPCPITDGTPWEGQVLLEIGLAIKNMNQGWEAGVERVINTTFTD